MAVGEAIRGVSETVVDAHLHLWSEADITLRWVPPPLLRRDFSPADHADLMRMANVGAAVLIEAGGPDDELWRLADDLASRGTRTAAVASLDLTSCTAAARIAALQSMPYIRALRMDLEGADDLEFLTRASTRHLLGLVTQAGLRWEFLVSAEQLTAVRRVLDRCPDLAAAIEHCGKPRLDDQTSLRRWRDEMRALAADSQVACKLSFGFRADSIDAYEAGVTGWPPVLSLIALEVVETFGAKRTMWGSDWPLSGLLGSYRDCLAFWENSLGSLSRVDRAQVFYGTALEFYGFEGH